MKRGPNYTRRAAGIAAGLALPIALLSSLVYAAIYGQRSSNAGLALTIAALIVGVLNCYLALVRPALLKRAQGSLKDDKYISGLPLAGTVLTLAGGILGFGMPACAGLGLLAMLIDTGGVPWLVAFTWRDPSFWDD